MHFIRVFQGIAYIQENDTDKIASLVCNKFRARISEELEVSYCDMCLHLVR